MHLLRIAAIIQVHGFWQVAAGEDGQETERHALSKRHARLPSASSLVADIAFSCLEVDGNPFRLAGLKRVVDLLSAIVDDRRISRGNVLVGEEC